jgi:hypothetical protein
MDRGIFGLRPRKKKMRPANRESILGSMSVSFEKLN